MYVGSSWPSAYVYWHVCVNHYSPEFTGRYVRYVLKNVEMSVSGNILTITVDLTTEFGPSSSGKTIIIASTDGNAKIPGQEVMGLNVCRRK